jgi:ectoine hydroxylase-related dioxygenase (phytanoyl-CoA dioxygenase family)
VLASERRRRELRDAVGASDLRWISGYVSVKDPHSLPLEWHQDWWCWDHPVSYRRPAPQIAVLCYLADADPSRAALRVLPGSHHRNPPLEREVTPRLRAGDAVVIDYRLLHGTHANTTSTRRDCVLLSFAPSWGELPADVRGHLVRHPAQPAGDEHAIATPWAQALLPRFDGVPADLPLNREPPRPLAI